MCQHYEKAIGELSEKTWASFIIHSIIIGFFPQNLIFFMPNLYPRKQNNLLLICVTSAFTQFNFYL